MVHLSVHVSQSWSRVYASLCPIFAPVFVLYVGGWLGLSVGSSSFPLWALLMALGGLVGACVYLTTHEGRPPHSFVYSMTFTVAAFIMCSAWIYTIASELVSVIEAMGTLWKIPSSLLGLTLLAWIMCGPQAT